jgi:class 3 adenylate cyclase
VRELGIDVRAGLHTGECELMDGKIGGIAVHTGARVASHAQPGEVLVSSTVKDLVAGSGKFRPRSTHRPQTATSNGEETRSVIADDQGLDRPFVSGSRG